ncbi:MAG TPA: hypothetical protein VFE58_01305 [Tepidisphaeraceae bacterium]|jgi:hypothetical protein|nr:hypothetical protein [Tepidisphaeraceae bacterium]
MEGKAGEIFVVEDGAIGLGLYFANSYVENSGWRRGEKATEIDMKRHQTDLKVACFDRVKNSERRRVWRSNGFPLLVMDAGWEYIFNREAFQEKYGMCSVLMIYCYTVEELVMGKTRSPEGCG